MTANDGLIIVRSWKRLSAVYASLWANANIDRMPEIGSAESAIPGLVSRILATGMCQFACARMD